MPVPRVAPVLLFIDSKTLELEKPVQFSAGTFNHIYGVYHCVVSNSSFSG